MNLTFIVRMGNTTFDAWHAVFKGDAEAQATFMRNTLVGRVDDHTAIVTTEVFDMAVMGAFMSDPRMAQLEAEMGLKHEVYTMAPMGPPPA